MAALRYENMHGDHNKLIACRICDCIFTSQKDLFDHIQLHLLLDESETKRNLLLSHMSSTFHPPAPPIQQQGWHWPRLSSALSPGVINVNPFSIGANARNLDQQLNVRPLPVSLQSTAITNISIPTLPRHINISPISIGADARNLDQQSTVRPLPVSYRSTVIRDNSVPIPSTPVSAPPQIRTVQQSGVELLARPFLQQLEDRLQIDGMASIKDGKAGNQEELDVTLKL